MCNKNNTTKKKKKQRTKTRKPKYLSLSKHIVETKPEEEMTKIPRPNPQNPQLTLFPLHPDHDENDRSFGDENENVALLFRSDSANDTSLTGLLQTTTTTTTTTTDDDDSLSYGRAVRENDTATLVRTAMKRSRDMDRDESEEKWVCYSEVVEEVTSSSKEDVVSTTKKTKKKKTKKTKKLMIKREEEEDQTTCSSESNSLSLKLDYQEILRAWSDKGSLYIQDHNNNNNNNGDLQTVPDLLHHDHQYHHGLMDGWGSSAGNLWKVPESGCLKIKEEIEGKDGWKLGQREASVLRYKEKRQSRLFAKRIRYEVRKLNAEKRPRMKGRFVKII